MMPLWKGSYDGWVLEEASPGFLFGAFAGDFKKFIYSDHLLITSQLSLMSSGRFGQFCADSQLMFYCSLSQKDMGVSELCLFGHRFNGIDWALDGFQTVCFYLKNDHRHSHISPSSSFSPLSCLFLFLTTPLSAFGLTLFVRLSLPLCLSVFFSHNAFLHQCSLRNMGAKWR